MEYIGKLYGKIGRKYFDTGHTSKDYDNVLANLKESLRLLRDLAEHQNGAPLIQHEKEYNKTMNEVWKFLEENDK